MDSSQDFVPNPTAKSTIRKRRLARLIRIYIYAAAVLTPILAFLAAVGPSAAPSAAGVRSSSGALATDVAANSVSRWSAPLDASSPVWISFSSATSDDGLRVETHNFGVTIDDLLYRVSVQVAVREDGTTWVLSQPSLEMSPQPDGAAANDASWYWPGAETYSPGDAITNAVTAWTRAYFGGTPTDLLGVTSDPTRQHAYSPVVGYQPGDISVSAGAVSPAGGVVVRAAVKLTPLTADTTLQVEFDLLLLDEDTATPAVVAWGPPGSGMQLQAYGNAVAGDRPQPDAPTTTTTTTVPGGSTPVTPAAPSTTAPPLFDPLATTTTTVPG